MDIDYYGVIAISSQALSLNIGNMVTPDLNVRDIMLILPEDSSAQLRIAELQVQQRGFRKLSVRCKNFAFSTKSMSCHGGSLAQLPGVALEFDYRFDTGNWRIFAQLHKTPGKRLAIFLPTTLPLLTQGELNGVLRLSGDTSGLLSIGADVQLTEVGFSDAGGLHAAEKLHGNIKFSASREAALWSWQGNITWQSGELFWQPLYLRGGHQIDASGSFDGSIVKVGQAMIDLPNTGRIQLAGL